MDQNQLTFSLGEPHVSPSQSQDLERDWMIRVAIWRSSFLDLWRSCSPSGLSGKMCPVSLVQTEEGTFLPSSGRFLNSGMGGPTESWTLNTSEYPSAVVESSLSDVLETGEVPQRFYLSPKACAGILRRAEKRGKKLPWALLEALKAASAILSVLCAATLILELTAGRMPTLAVWFLTGGGNTCQHARAA